jgi:hypothetical protein
MFHRLELVGNAHYAKFCLSLLRGPAYQGGAKAECGDQL